MRYYLQIRFKDNGDLFWFRRWCINEPFKTLRGCKEMADGMLDDSVENMRIVDSVKNEIVETYR